MKLKKKAESYYKKALKRAVKLVGNKTTYDHQLDFAGKKLFGKRFLGVTTSDHIPETIPKDNMLIINLDSSKESGSHWVAAVKDKDTGTILVYDSFGRKTHEILPSIYGNRDKEEIQDTEHDAEQKKKETNCGARCLAFLIVYDELGYDFARCI